MQCKKKERIFSKKTKTSVNETWKWLTRPADNLGGKKVLAQGYRKNYWRRNKLANGFLQKYRVVQVYQAVTRPRITLSKSMIKQDTFHHFKASDRISSRQNYPKYFWQQETYSLQPRLVALSLTDFNSKRKRGNQYWSLMDSFRWYRKQHLGIMSKSSPQYQNYHRERCKESSLKIQK